MNKKKADLVSYVSGYIQNRDTIRLLSVVDQVVELGGTCTNSDKWIRSSKQRTYFYIDWSATKICIIEKPEFHIFVTGPSGKVSVAAMLSGVAQDWEEEIDSSSNGPKSNGDIRDMRLIGKHLYVTGMGRQVYRREGRYKWVRQDTGVLQAPSLTEVKGFNSIDGVDEDYLYAVGFGGEIWRCVNGTWLQGDSPTNIILNKVLVVNPKQVYICGQRGTLFYGYDNQWGLIDQGQEEDDFWDMAWYREALYVSSDNGIYRLDPKDNSLSPVKMGIKKKLTFGYLHANDGVLASFGNKHVCITEDGNKWEDITYLK